MSIGAEVDIVDITGNPEACFEAAQLVGSRIEFAEAPAERPFQDGNDVLSRLSPTLVLAVYGEHEMLAGQVVVGALIAKEYGTRARNKFAYVAERPHKYAGLNKWEWGYDTQGYGWSVGESSTRRDQVFSGLSVEYLAVGWMFEGQGIGRQLMGHAIDFAKSRALEEVTLVQAPKAAGFYDRLGFELPLNRKFQKRRLKIDSDL